MLRRFLAVIILAVALIWINFGLAHAQAKGGNVLATIGAITVTQQDLDDFVKSMPESIQSRYGSVEAKTKLLDSIVDAKVFAIEAQRVGLDKNPQISKRVELSRERILSHEYLTKNVLEKVEVDEAEAKKFYDEHKKDFDRPAQARIRQILVGSEAEAKAIAEELKKGGDFGAIAKQKSTDSFAAKGGMVGWIEKSANPTPYEQAAFAIKRGQISDPVKTDKGYYIIKSEGARPEFKRTYEQAKAGLIAKLKMDKQKELLEKVKGDLRKQMKVTVNYNLIKADAPKEKIENKKETGHAFEKALKQLQEKGKSGESNPFIDALKKAIEEKKAQ